MKGIYGEKWGVFYYRVNVAERIAYAFSLAVIGLLVAPLTGEIILVVLSPVLAVLGFILASGRVLDAVKQRETQILKQFPNVVSNLALLINSGMDTFSAWKMISENSEGILYEEMQNTITDMTTQGTPEIQAYVLFGKRCAIPRISKFIAMMVQNISKGSEDLIEFLIYESSICWTEKKNNAKIQGEKAGSKLMIPIFLIMVGILILILGPMASNLNL
jgi:tight adherence protein C